MNEQFTVADLHYVFGIDALESSRPIDFEVNTPAEINQMFDAISYEKGEKNIPLFVQLGRLDFIYLPKLFIVGSCVIRMCADFLGEATFRRGITRYLQEKYLTCHLT